MKKATIFAILVIASLLGAVASSYCMAVFTGAQTLFGVMAMLFAVTFTVFVNKLTESR